MAGVAHETMTDTLDTFAAIEAVELHRLQVTLRDRRYWTPSPHTEVSGGRQRRGESSPDEYWLVTLLVATPPAL